MSKSILNLPKNDCYGCTACASICALGAIEMLPDEKGFVKPVLKGDKCKNCGLCEKTCPSKNADTLKNTQQPKIYAVKHKDEAIRNKSTSGGAFTAFADALREQNAVVYGAAFCENGAHHIRVDDGNIEALRGSKYVQSYLQDSFGQIKQDLLDEKTVLFTGTPCQCGGLKQFLSFSGVSTDGLYLIDLICHGTSSPLLLKEYLRHCEKKAGKKIVDHRFRSKKKGWHNHLEENVFADGTLDDTSFDSQIAKSIFYSGYAFSERCYTCEYASVERTADITLGDFWGIGSAMPDFDDNKGVSMVMVNTAKGEALMKLSG